MLPRLRLSSSLFPLQNCIERSGNNLEIPKKLSIDYCMIHLLIRHKLKRIETGSQPVLAHTTAPNNAVYISQKVGTTQITSKEKMWYLPAQRNTIQPIKRSVTI